MVCCSITGRDFTLIHNSNVYYHIHNSPPTVLIPSKINRSQILFPYDLFQFILPCLGLPKVSFTQDCRLQSLINFSSFPPIIDGAVHPMLLDLITFIIYGHRKTRLLIMQFSSAALNLHRLRSKCSLQLYFIKHF